MNGKNGLTILNLRFNQDFGKIIIYLHGLNAIINKLRSIICALIPGCFTASMENGVRIYNLEPLVEKSHYGK